MPVEWGNNYSTGGAMKAVAAVLVLVLAACVDAPLAPDLQREIPFSAQWYEAANGDSLGISPDGTYQARAGEGFGVDSKLPGYAVRFWALGKYELRGDEYCARPNSQGAALPLRCGARVAGGVIADSSSVFLWDGVPRAWRVK